MKRTVALLRLYAHDIACVNLSPLAVNERLYSVGIFLSCLCAGNAYCILCCICDERQLAVRVLVNSVLCSSRNLVPFQRYCAVLGSCLHSGLVVNLDRSCVCTAFSGLYAANSVLEHIFKVGVVGNVLDKNLCLLGLNYLFELAVLL